MGEKAETKLERCLSKMGLVSSLNSGALVNDNALGVHMLGGTGVIKANVIDMNPIHIQFPHFSAGCGGISYGMGAINLVTGQEMIDAAKAILKNAGAYAFELSLHVITPIIDAKMGGILSQAIDLNAININSCEIGRTLVNYGASFTKNSNVSKYICEHGGNHALAKDYIETRHNCNASPDLRKQEEDNLSDLSDYLGSEYNLTWVIFNKMRANLSDEEKTLFLNLTGTIIRKKTGTKKVAGFNEQPMRTENQYESKVYPPKEEEVWSCLLKGGTIKNAYFFHGGLDTAKEGSFLSPDTAQNLANIGVKTLTIDPKSSWGWVTLKTMRGLRDKILSGRAGNKNGKGNYALTQAETDLLKGSNLPLATLLTISASKKGRAALSSLSEYADLIAFLKIYDLFEEVLEKIKETAFSIEAAQIESTELAQYIRTLEEVRGKLQARKTFVFQQIENTRHFVKFLREEDQYRRTLEAL